MAHVVTNVHSVEEERAMAPIENSKSGKFVRVTNRAEIFAVDRSSLQDIRSLKVRRGIPRRRILEADASYRQLVIASAERGSLSFL